MTDSVSEILIIFSIAGVALACGLCLVYAIRLGVGLKALEQWAYDQEIRTSQHQNAVGVELAWIKEENRLRKAAIDQMFGHLKAKERK